jgi:hypothetical protein
MTKCGSAPSTCHISRTGCYFMTLLLNGSTIFALLTLIGAVFGSYNLEDAEAIVELAEKLEFPFLLYGVALIVGSFGSYVAYDRRIEESDTYFNPVHIYQCMIRKLTTKSWWADHLSDVRCWIAIILVFVSIFLFVVASWIVVTELSTFSPLISASVGCVICP